MRAIVSAALASVAFVSSPIVAAAQGCDGILSLTRNISYETKSAKLAQNIYQEQCQGSSLKTSWNGDVSLGTVIQQVPLQLRLAGGSTKEKASHLCSKYDDWQLAVSDATRASISTDEPAITAWSLCMRQQGESAFLTVNPVRERVAISIKRGSRDNPRFYGISYSPENMTCSGPFGTDGANVVVSDNMSFEISQGGEFPIVCDRIKKTDPSGAEFFPAETFVIKVQGAQPQPVPLNRENLAGDIFLSEVEKRVDALEKSFVDYFRKALSCEVFSTVSQNLTTQAAPTINQSATIPEGYFLTGGGCEVVQPTFFDGALNTGAPTADKRSWYCRSTPFPNAPLTRAVKASAIGCKFE